jgi:hypothetical protein
MIDRLAGNKLLAANIRRYIIERTEKTAAVVPSPAVAVPPSLHASLMARLDRLGPAKGVAQIGAAIGREFLARRAGSGGAQARGGAQIGTRPDDFRRFTVPAGPTAACERGLRHPNSMDAKGLSVGRLDCDARVRSPGVQ